MMYKGFEIKEVTVNGTRWFAAYLNGRQLVKYTEFMGQRTGATVPMLFLDVTNAKRTIRYLLKTESVEDCL